MIAKSILLASSASLLLATGCVVRETRYRSGPPVVVEGSVGAEVVVGEAPPAPIVEEMVVAPGPDFVWIGGIWVWNGRWAWERGHWGHRPYAGARWVSHRYIYRGGHHVFIRGGWR